MEDLNLRNWINPEGAEEALIIMIKLIKYNIKYAKDTQYHKIKGIQNLWNNISRFILKNHCNNLSIAELLTSLPVVK